MASTNSQEQYLQFSFDWTIKESEFAKLFSSSSEIGKIFGTFHNNVRFHWRAELTVQSDDSPGIGLYLRYLGPMEKFNMEYEVSILKPDLAIVDTARSPNHEAKRFCCWGWKKFFDVKDPTAFRAKYGLKESDPLVIRITLKIPNSVFAATTATPPAATQKWMTDLFADIQNSDKSVFWNSKFISRDGTVFYVHKAISYQSDALQTAFHHPPPENEYELDLGSTSLKALVQFLYTGQVDLADLTTKDLMELADAAKTFNLKPLFDACAVVLWKEVVDNPDLCAQIPRFAHLHDDLTDLKRGTMDVMGQIYETSSAVDNENDLAERLRNSHLRLQNETADMSNVPYGFSVWWEIKWSEFANLSASANLSKKFVTSDNNVPLHWKAVLMVPSSDSPAVRFGLYYVNGPIGKFNDMEYSFSIKKSTSSTAKKRKSSKYVAKRGYGRGFDDVGDKDPVAFRAKYGLKESKPLLIRIRLEIPSRVFSCAPYASPPPVAHNWMVDLFDNIEDPDESIFWDAKLISSDGGVFYCHKMIAYQSETLQAIFRHPTPENEYKFQCLDGALLWQLIQYLYTGQADLDLATRKVIELADTAEQYKLIPLKRACVAVLWEELVENPASCAEILPFACLHKLVNLKYRAMDMLADNYKLLLDADGDRTDDEIFNDFFGDDIDLRNEFLQFRSCRILWDDLHLMFEWDVDKFYVTSPSECESKSEDAESDWITD